MFQFKIPHKLTKLDSQGISQLNQNFAYLNQFFQQSPFTKFGSGANYFQIGNDGTIIFKGTAGLCYGSCYGNHINWTQASAAEDTWYNISDDTMSDTFLHNVAHDGSGKLTVVNAGLYLIGYSVCFENNVANDHVEAGIEVSDSHSAVSQGICHLENKFSGEEEHMGSITILDLVAGATVELAIRTIDDNTPNFTVHAINLTIVQIAGT